MRPSDRPWLAAAVILLTLVTTHYLHDILSLSSFYVGLREQYPFYVRSTGRNILQVLICVAAAWVLCKQNPLRSLGFTGSLRQGLLFGAVATAPMFIGFALTSPIATSNLSVPTAYLAGVSPLTEEIVYRAFACGLLFVVARTPAWFAIVVPALIFGWGHVNLDTPAMDSLGIFLLVSAGGIAFAWFYLRWSRNLWVPLFTHALANFSWELFEVGESALGGWFPFAMQATMVLLGIGLTLRFTGSINPRGASTEWVEAVSAKPVVR
jgi:membrane protease YdiL (CAAX protease family)